MKRILFTFLFMLAILAGYTQMTNNGGIITVENGAVLVIEGDYTSTNSGDIEIDGTVQLKGHFVNNSGTINANSDGTLAFVGTSAQEIKGSVPTTFGCDVQINNAAGVSITTANQVMSKNLTFTSGKLTLGAYDLTLAASSAITGAGSGSYVVTNGAGSLKRPVGATDVAFPVGNAGYNPIILNEALTADTYGVNFSDALPGGWTGGASHHVLGHWTVTEGTPGGNDLTATAEWVGTQEQAFDRTDCAVGVSTDNGATFSWDASSGALGGDPYTQVGSGFASVGKFMVGDYFFGGFLVDLDLFLAGPYNVGTGLMNIGLKTKNLIPLTDPYGLGVTVGSIPANVVDWIKVELRDKNNASTILYTKAFFLDNTGNVIDTDGVTANAKFTGVPKDLYYIAVKHRNHLGARTDATVDLNSVNPAFNFKSGTGVYTNPAYTYTPQLLITTGVYGLYKGNVNSDTRVAKTGAQAINDMTALLNYLGINTSILNVYTGADVTCDGDVRKTGAAAVNDMTQLLNSLGTFTAKFQHFTP
jgi:hypothetical protein